MGLEIMLVNLAGEILANKPQDTVNRGVYKIISFVYSAASSTF
jgi:hypothetical protein